MTTHGRCTPRVSPFCPYTIKTKTKQFVKSLFKQDESHQTHSTMNSRNLQKQIRALDPELITTTIHHKLTTKSTFELITHLQTQHEQFLKILQYYSITKTKPIKNENEAELNALNRQLNCIICMDKPRNAVILPCMHYIACHNCLSKTKNNCPLCRTIVSSILTILPS